MTARAEVPGTILADLRSICRALPEAVEEPAWVGTRWRIRTRTFAHVLTIADGWPPVYAAAAGEDGPANVLMFRSAGEELHVLRGAGAPFFAPPWRADEVGLRLTEPIDLDEVAELLTDSYCLLAPAKLVRLVERPTPPPE